MPRKLIWCGEQGECAFTEPFIEWTAPIQELPGLLQRIEKTGDDRSFVLLSAVVVERYVVELMNSLSPGFARLAENRDFTFSLKLEILKALRLIPPHILQAADLVRKIRNDFAHDFNTDDLAKCNAKHREAMRQTATEMYGEHRVLSSERDDFKSVTLLALVGLQAYRANFKKLRVKLSDPRVIEEWKKECHEELLEKVKGMQSGTPTRIEERNGWRCTHYEEGLVNIEAVASEDPPSTLGIDLTNVNLKKV
ncbi:MAG: hypothetical protein ABSD98_09295 [Candidatus Korobacteraceae bacterium]|jgi:hypothetical protein